MSEYKEVAGEVIKRGEIYWFRDVGTEGSEQEGRRPCVVVSNDKANQFGPIVTIVPFTTVDKKKPLPTHIAIDSAFVPSVALCEQVKTISKDRLSQYIGECTEEELKAIEGGLCIQLGIEKTTLKVQKVQSPVVMQMPTRPIEPPAPAVPVTMELEEMRQRCTAEKARADVFEKLYKDLLTEKLTR